MVSDHHGRVTDIATSLLTAMDGILGTHRRSDELARRRQELRTCAAAWVAPQIQATQS